MGLRPPELSGNSVTLPEPSRIPGRREIAVIRGHADSLALTASCHDVKLHNKLVPPAGPARAGFEAVERARVEAIGSNRMPGMASNITAKVEDHYSHGRYRDVKDRANAPLEDALALIVRERLTGAKAPDNAKALVEIWRPWVEEKAGKTLARLDELSNSQAKFGRALRDVLKSLDLSEDLSESGEQSEDDRDEDQEQGDADNSEDSDNMEARESEDSEQSASESEDGEDAESSEDGDRGLLDVRDRHWTE